jgi:TonB family protein
VAGQIPGDPFVYVLARGAGRPRPARLVVLAETSAAMTGDYRERQRAAIRALVAALPPGTNVTLLATDWRTELVANQVDSSNATAALAKLAAIVPAGSLYLERVLGEAATTARALGADAIFFVGIGGKAIEPRAAANTRLFQQFAEAGLGLHVVDVGDGDKGQRLHAFARLTGGEVLSSRTLGVSLGTVARGLVRRPIRPKDRRPSVGAWHSLPMVTGEPAWIARASQAPEGVVVSEPLGAELRSLWERARLGWNGQTPIDGEPAASVLAPETALLVLESASDYESWGLRQPSGASHVSAVPWHSARTSSAGIPPATTLRHAYAPDVVAGKSLVRGSLDAGSIRRTIRRRINEVRFCYEQELLKAHTLHGRLTLQLTIVPSGRVATAIVKRSTLANAAVDQCIIDAAKAWSFPATADGGDAVVTYPFVLVPVGMESPADDDQEALASLTGDDSNAQSIATIARSFGLPAGTDAVTLAWRIDDRATSLARLRLVARLLDLGGRQADAIRVLSERALTDPTEIATDLTGLHADSDAAEVLRLSR